VHIDPCLNCFDVIQTILLYRVTFICLLYIMKAYTLNQEHFCLYVLHVNRYIPLQKTICDGNKILIYIIQANVPKMYVLSLTTKNVMLEYSARC